MLAIAQLQGKDTSIQSISAFTAECIFLSSASHTLVSQNPRNKMSELLQVVISEVRPSVMGKGKKNYLETAAGSLNL